MPPAPVSKHLKEERMQPARQKEDIQEKLATGQITIAEAVGISRKQLYLIAEEGYKLLMQGRLEEARQIYAGLVAASPFDSVFHCHLGAVLWRMGDLEKALEEYDASLQFNIANVDALAGRGELLLLKGEIRKGLEDLRKALETDPKLTRPSTVRARALVLSIHQAAQQNQAEK
ncbi:MAG: hypothetical protein HC846_12465 [Blastocatellia bacterium]|nr:hypothetical protein [Blastocatellia bacterium]